MTTFFTADTHFQHDNIIRFCARPFRSAAEMDDAMIRNWNATVQPDDTVYHLGDVAFGDVSRLMPRLRSLSGKKYLIPGNHDDQDKLEVLSNVFTILPPLVEVNIQVNERNIKISLCHYPMESWNRSGRKALMLHGHNHGRMAENNQRLDVGVDCWKFYPARLEDILNRLKKLPRYKNSEIRQNYESEE